VGLVNRYKRKKTGVQPVFSFRSWIVLSFCRNYRNERTVVRAFVELHNTIAQGENRMIFSKTYVLTGMMFGAALANDDITGNHLLTAKDFYTEAFAMRFAAVLTTTCSFFMCHFVG
jgi:hypothetical protein